MLALLTFPAPLQPRRELQAAREAGTCCQPQGMPDFPSSTVCRVLSCVGHPGVQPPTCPQTSSAPPSLRASAPHLHPRSTQEKWKGQNRAGGVFRIFWDTLEAVCIDLKQINNTDLLGPKEQNQSTSSEAALPVALQGHQLAFCSLLAPFSCLVFPQVVCHFPTKASGLCQTSCLLQCINSQ